MSGSQPSDLREEELANAPVHQDMEDSDLAEHATVPADELGEQNPAVHGDVQQAVAEEDAVDDVNEVAVGPLVEQSGELQQKVEGEPAEGTLNLQDASILQQDALPDSSPQNGAEDEAAEHGLASISPAMETEQDGEPAETSPVSTASDSAADASSGHVTAAEQFSGAAGWSYSAQEQLVPGALASALANPELDPDHPLLARAQKALSKQLLAIKDRLEAEVREKAIALQVCQPSIWCCLLSASL